MDTIFEAPHLTNVTQLMSFLELVNYYGKFVPNLATLLKPLRNLLCVKQSWDWTTACEKAYNDAKRALQKSEVLVHFNLKL